MEKAFEVRDMRVKEKFFINDEYLNGYAKLCGWKATLVYLCLCRHADRHQEAFPSVKLMSEKLGISKRSVNRAISDLVEWNIIGVSQRKSDGGVFDHNLYALKDKKEWKVKPSVPQARGSRAPHSQAPSATQSKNRAPHSRPKDTQFKETQEKERAVSAPEYTETDSFEEDSERVYKNSASSLDRMTDTWRVVNPVYNNWYRHNKTERKSLDRLISEEGEEWIETTVPLLVQTNGTPFFPTITKPSQLYNKRAELKAALMRHLTPKQTNKGRGLA